MTTPDPDVQGEGVRCGGCNKPLGTTHTRDCPRPGMVVDEADCQPIPEGERTFTEAEVSAAIRWFEGEIRSGDDVITPWAIWINVGWWHVQIGRTGIRSYRMPVAQESVRDQIRLGWPTIEEALAYLDELYEWTPALSQRSDPEGGTDG